MSLVSKLNLEFSHCFAKKGVPSSSLAANRIAKTHKMPVATSSSARISEKLITVASVKKLMPEYIACYVPLRNAWRNIAIGGQLAARNATYLANLAMSQLGRGDEAR